MNKGYKDLDLDPMPLAGKFLAVRRKQMMPPPFSRWEVSLEYLMYTLDGLVNVTQPFNVVSHFSPTIILWESKDVWKLKNSHNLYHSDLSFLTA